MTKKVERILQAPRVRKAALRRLTREELLTLEAELTEAAQEARERLETAKTTLLQYVVAAAELKASKNSSAIKNFQAAENVMLAAKTVEVFGEYIQEWDEDLRLVQSFRA